MPLRCIHGLEMQPGAMEPDKQHCGHQSEERRLSGLSMRHSKRKQAGGFIWEHCMDGLCHSPLLWLLPLVLLAQSPRSPLWGSHVWAPGLLQPSLTGTLIRTRTLGCSCSGLRMEPEPRRAGDPTCQGGAGASMQLSLIPLMAFFGLIDIEGSLLPGQFPWRDNKRSFSSEQNFNGTFW